MKNRRSMRGARLRAVELAILCCLIFTSCNDMGTDLPGADLIPMGLAEGTRGVTFHNAGLRPVWYAACERELSNLIDPRPWLLIAESGAMLIPPGRTVPARISGYEAGKGIRIFLYRVSSGDLSRAYPAGLLDVSASDLERSRYRVEIRDP